MGRKTMETFIISKVSTVSSTPFLAYRSLFLQKSFENYYENLLQPFALHEWVSEAGASFFIPSNKTIGRLNGVEPLQ